MTFAATTGGAITLLDPPVTVMLRRSARARRLTLRVAATDGSVHLTLPRRVSLAEAAAFVGRQEGWLRARLAETPPPVVVGMGTRLPVEGQLLRLAPGEGRSAVLAAGELRVPGPAERAGSRAVSLLKALARDRLVAAADRHAAVLRRAPGSITLRDPVTRWGSCSATGDLMFSWRLIMAPPAVLDYVAAHEVAHLAEMNHGAAFWAAVARLCPGWRPLRVWLRREGPALHRYRFA
jgi:hypothetical protein